MKKWSNGAKKRKAALDEREAVATDMEVLVAAIAKLPPGQLKKVLTQDIIDILAKYGVVIK